VEIPHAHPFVVGFLELRDLAIGVSSSLLATLIWTMFCQPKAAGNKPDEATGDAPQAGSKVTVEIDTGEETVKLELSGCTQAQVELQVRKALQNSADRPRRIGTQPLF
jgi:hypothetical protein